MFMGKKNKTTVQLSINITVRWLILIVHFTSNVCDLDTSTNAYAPDNDEWTAWLWGDHMISGFSHGANYNYTYCSK